MVIHGISDFLLRSQVALRRLYRYVPEQELDLFKFPTCNVGNWICSSSPPATWHSRAQERLKSWGAIFSMPTLLARFRTTYQTTFSVTPFPQTLPVLLIDRNRQPDAVPDACVHSSIRFFTHSGTGTVRTCPPLPIRSTMAQWPSRC